MAVFVAGMLVLILLAVILAGWMLMALERETRRQCCALREELAKVRGELSALFQGVRGADGHLKELAEVVGRFEKDMREGQPRSADEEAQDSRDMLEGIENLMRYSLSTAREKGEAGR